MTNKPHKNILYTLRTIFKNASIDINSLFKEGIFDKDPSCKYNNYMNRFYHQVLKETAEGPISADIYRHCMEASQRDGMILAYIQNQTPDLCLAAVNQNGGALYYVKNQTNKIAEVAVRSDPSIFPYVKDKTDTITKMAIKADGLNIAYVDEQTPVYNNTESMTELDTILLDVHDTKIYVNRSLSKMTDFTFITSGI